MAKLVKRLFSDFQPTHYILDLVPNREKMTFSGNVIVSGLKSSRPSQRITLHQNGLKISKAHITRHDKKGDEQIEVTRINNHSGQDEVRLHSSQTLFPGRYTISLEFSGKITKQMHGMYPCNFKIRGKDKVIIATQFESHHAREVFPCIDEPEAKATFDLTLTSPDGETAVANTPIKSQKKVRGKLVTEFETTPKMSTYLLAFVYGDLDYLESKTKKGVSVRTYATPNNVAISNFALEVAVKCLDFYADYFDIDYPLEKCDLLALPDFAAGAMENWGCITFREHALLVDPKHTSLGSKQYVALVVAHELAHMWFGNLVTMRWWTDLWLNEGFASWIEYLAIDSIFPEWQMWTQFIVDEQQQALKLDALEHTHPIEAPINHPDEIRTIFDAVSYSKGSSVINMLHQYLGSESFKTGLRYYLNKHAYSNTETQDLWEAFESVTDKPVKDFMHAWTTQPGFPIIDANVNNSKASLKQQRFFTNPKHGKVPETKWPVPLLTADSKALQLFKDKSSNFDISTTSRFKLNQGQSGFYRVNYNSSHLAELGNQIRRGRISVVDRLGVLSDMTEAAKAGQADTADVLHFLLNFKEESDFAVWDVIASLIGSIRLVMNDEKLREQIKPFVLNLTSKQLKRLGWHRKKDESHFDRLLRPIILGLASSVDEPTVVEKCFELFKSIKHAEDLAPDLKSVPSRGRVKRGADIDPDLRGTVYGTVARLGGKEEYDKLLYLHNSSDLSEERVTLSAALTGFKQPELINEALGMITSDEVRLQDVTYWIAYSFLNRHGKDQAWAWLKDSWGWLEEHLGTDLSFYRMPIYVSRSFSNIEFLKDYKKFFTGVMNPGLERSYNQGIEIIQWQSAWKDRSLKEIKVFLESYSKTGKN